MKDLFSVEATNSAGAPRVELIVDGVSFGKLTALDLMRLKTILTSKQLEDMYANIPVRSDSEVILKDPNLDPANYNAKVTVKKKTVETGDYTLQKFTGAWTQRQRAELLQRRSKILAAVIEGC